KGYLWVSCFSGNLFRLKLNYNQHKISAEKDNIRQMFPESFGGKLFLDSKGNIWVGSRYVGLQKFSYNTTGELQTSRILNVDNQTMAYNIGAEDEEGHFFLFSQLGLDKLIS